MPRPGVLAVGLAAAVLHIACGTASGPSPGEGVPASPTAGTTAGSAATSAATATEGTRTASATTITATPPAAGGPPPVAPVVTPVGTSSPQPTGPASSRTPPSSPSVGGGPTGGLDCLAAVIKRHPVDLAPYVPSSGRAGDVAFVRPVLFNRVYTEFGFVIPAASSSTGNDKPNPQPTYLAPTGTKVRSAVDGVVERIADLWSTPTLGDVSVMVKPDGLTGRCYMVVEFEHVIRPTVRVGDRVSAGQVIAEVGPLNSQGSSGLGLVEFGVLTASPNGRPLHACPYAYFDPSVRDAQIGALARLLADWEVFAGDASLYRETAWAGGVVGCRSGPIEE